MSSEHTYAVEVVALVVSPVDRYDGRPSAGRPALDGDRRDRIEERAGSGVVGDRYAGRAAHRDAAVTVLAAEAVEAVAAELGVPAPDPALARRTVVLRGAEVEALRGRTFSLDSGEGAVVLGGGRPAHPCAWLDVALVPGAHRGLRGRAGIRCSALSDGALRLGPAVLRSPVPLDPARAGTVLRPVSHRRDGGP